MAARDANTRADKVAKEKAVTNVLVLMVGGGLLLLITGFLIGYLLGRQGHGNATRRRRGGGVLA